MPKLTENYYMRYLIIIIISASFFACKKDDSSPSSCGTHNGKQLYKGPEGGCYYINSNGNKTYVESSECTC